jgi:ATP-dependent helicase HrpB
LAPDLPVTEALPALAATLEAGLPAVLVAPPGAGKTTLVPLELLAAPWRGDRKILMLEPRRLATRAAATRMASLLSEPVGRTVGFRTRIDTAVSSVTRIEVITEGLLTRRLLADPGLDGVAAIILDEIHERSVESDLALALCLDLRSVLRPDIRLVAMSATADGARLAGLMNAKVIESTGRAFPVTIEHARTGVPSPRELPSAMARAVGVALAEHEGDILAFLPGMAEIRRTQTALSQCPAAVLPLHGDLPPAEQDRALRSSGERRVILATSIAETSLTVPGVRIVIDGGWRRVPRLDPSTGLTRLATVRVSRAAADQRAGRAGREAPGIAFRLWTPAEHRGLASFDRAEILEAELSPLVLTCAAWGTVPEELRFQDTPSGGALNAARSLLTDLGALRERTITDAGRSMAVLGAHPRLAAMMRAAETDSERALAADLAALLEERDPLRANEISSDIRLRWQALRDGHDNADRGILSRVRRAAAQYRRRLNVTADAEPCNDAGGLLAAAFPDRIAQRRGDPGSFRFSGGGGGRMSRADPLATVPLLVAASVDMKESARIRLAAPVDPEHLPPSLAARVVEQTETGFDAASGTVLARRRRRLGTLVLSDRTVPMDPVDVANMLAGTIADQSLKPLKFSEEARQFRSRVALMRQLEPDRGWPDLSDPALIATVRDWLVPHLGGATRLADLDRLDLLAIFRRLLPRHLIARLDQAAPTHLDLPRGRAMIDYTEVVPTVAAKAQAFYGLATTPVLVQGQVKPRFALLSPAGRTIAVTSDLASFWRSSWADARRDMRGRYPKHDWPENPAEV